MKKLLIIIGLVLLSGCAQPIVTASSSAKYSDGLYHVEVQCARVTVDQATISALCGLTSANTMFYECDAVERREYGAVCFLGVPSDVVIELYEGRMLPRL